MGTDTEAADTKRRYRLFSIVCGFVISELVEGYVGATCGELQGDGPSDAARTTGNECDLASKVTRI